MDWSNKLSLRTKVLAVLAFIAVIAGIIGVIGYSNINAIEIKDDIFNEDYNAPSKKLALVNAEISKASVNLEYFILVEDKKLKENYLYQLRSNIKVSDRIIRKINIASLNAKGKENFSAFSTYWNEYTKYVFVLVSASEEGNYDKLITARNNVRKTYTKVHEYLQNLTNLNSFHQHRITQKNLVNISLAKTQMSGLIFVGIVFAIGLGIFIFELINKADTLHVIAIKHSNRNMKHAISLEHISLISKLKKLFKKMTTYLTMNLKVIK